MLNVSLEIDISYFIGTSTRFGEDSVMEVFAGMSNIWQAQHLLPFLLLMADTTDLNSCFAPEFSQHRISNSYSWRL